MEISKGVAGIAAAVCLVAGAGSAYLVTRSGSSPAPVAVAAEEPTVSPDPAAPVVDQSEAVVSEPATPAPARVEQPASAPRRSKAPAAAAPRPRAADTSTSVRGRAGEVDDDYVAPQREPEPPVAVAPTMAPQLPEPEPVAPAAPRYEELVVSADSVIGLEVDSQITSERARVEDPVTARISRDVRVGDRVAVPAGAQAIGEVTLVERGGKMRERARLGVRFTSIVLADGTRIPIETETIIREGSSPANESAAKIGGGAIGGAIIGGILGGAKGAIIGGSAGAGAGTAAVMAGGRNAATLASGSPVTVRLLKPATVTVEQ